ncbi:hypothetical protein FNV43_RR24108 [Rhamnella rubrinervis]|uniref:MBD domain-containing protein n=1 Tax=Rhamnella rubrinervis TaxID=2594499 RepID=A0A8K0DQI7_9ROSA|nr:hypothetical protein FNV43_RR24108 [Rhamnella rubrinervis]
MAETEDWLPPGWTVEVKLRNNGRKDKYYYASPSGPKFNSRVEVVVEKVIAEGLPAGWTKEIRVTKNGHKIRRDPFYIDPESGKTFRSMKDVYRYLETEELGRLEKKLMGGSHEDLKYDEISSPPVTKKQKLAVGRSRRQINFGQSRNSNELLKDEQIPDSKFIGECQSLPEITSDQDPQEVKVSEQKEKDSNSSKSALVSAPAVEVLQDKKSLECGLTKHESGNTKPGMRKSKVKKEINWPRRASKRLAGLDVGPIPELKTRTRTRHAAVKQSGDGVAHTDLSSTPGNSSDCAFQQPDQLKIMLETKCTVVNSKATELISLQPNKSRHLPVDMVTPEKHIGKVEMLINCDSKADGEPELPLELPLEELLTDPCIAFAIKTLTGTAFDNSKISEVFPGSEHSSGNIAIPEELARKVETESKVKREQGSSVVLPPVNCTIPKGRVETDNKADENSGYPIEFPLGSSWPDPCIEFAIKTLTDAIPLDYDYFQQQLSSSNTQAHSDLSMKTVGSENFSQSENLHSQFCDVEKPVLNQQVSLSTPGGSAGNHHGNGRH